MEYILYSLLMSHTGLGSTLPQMPEPVPQVEQVSMDTPEIIEFKIKKGMDKDEVYESFGTPDSTSSDMDTWYYYGNTCVNEGGCSVVFEKNRVSTIINFHPQYLSLR